MTLYEFNNLDEMGQLQAVWISVFLLHRLDGAFTFSLFQIDGFYVETRSKSDEEGGMLEMRSFKTTDFLDPYLEQINLDDVVYLTHF